MSNKTDYGLLLLSVISAKDEYVSLSHLVQQTKLPQRFTARIASELVKEGILQSREGKIGGYKLAKKLDQVSLFDFLKIFEHDVEPTKCEIDGYNCKFEDICQHQSFFKRKLSGLFKQELMKWTLADVIMQKIPNPSFK